MAMVTHGPPGALVMVQSCMAFPCRLRKLAGAMLEAGLVKVVPNLVLKGKWLVGAPRPTYPVKILLNVGIDPFHQGLCRPLFKLIASSVRTERPSHR